MAFTRPYFLLNTSTRGVVAVHEFRFRQMCHLPAMPLPAPLFLRGRSVPSMLQTRGGCGDDHIGKGRNSA